MEKKKKILIVEDEKNIKEATTNLLLIQKNIAKLSKSITETLKQFEQYKNDVIDAKKKHAQGMAAYNKLVESHAEEIENLKKELAKLEKKVDAKMLAKYKKMREDKKFPIFVPLLNSSCGGCSMGLAVSQVNKLEEKGMLPPSYKPHKLSGNYAGFWEAHIKGDWLLVWQIHEEELTLILTNTGTHSDLF